MKLHIFNKFNVLAFILMIPLSLGFHPASEAQEDSSEIYETDITEEMEVLETGPVHEAFAETSTTHNEPGLVVPKAPPDPIEEVPPERDDLEEGARWIPGYWAWDDDRNDFIWISGTYRVPPPDREWVPGEWIEVEQGYQWVSGYWADRTNFADSDYLPEPPESLEEGPNSEAPSPDHAWIPGCWVWTHGYYAWRPGYWMLVRPDWIWVPAYYVWTPHGYIYAGGYWDYTIARRGILFAPVYFYPRFFHRVVFHYRPSFVIGLTVFSDHLFIRPRYRHYYFGNYWAAKYHKRGIYSWRSRHARRHGHDPIYRHQEWKKKRHRARWEDRKHPRYRKQRDDDRRRNPHNKRGRGKDERQRKRPGEEPKYRAKKYKPLEKNRQEKYRAKKYEKKEGLKRNHRAKRYPKVRQPESKNISRKEIPNKPRLKHRSKKAPRPDHKPISVKRGSMSPRAKYKNRKAPRPSSKTISRKRTPTKDVRVRNRNNKNSNQLYKKRQAHPAKEWQRYSRGGTVNRGRKPVIRNQKANNRGNHLNRSRRNTPRSRQMGQFGRGR